MEVVPLKTLFTTRLLLSLALGSVGLESSTGLEADGLGSLDLDGSASLRVAAGTGSANLDREGAEADQLDVAVLLDTGGDTVEHGVNSAASSSLGFKTSFLVGENGFDEILFIHVFNSLS